MKIYIKKIHKNHDIANKLLLFMLIKGVLKNKINFSQTKTRAFTQAFLH